MKVSILLITSFLHALHAQQYDPAVPHFGGNNDVVRKVYYENNPVQRERHRVGNPFANVVLGVATCSLSSFLLWWNEGRAVRDVEMLRRAKASVMSFDENDPEATDDTLVHVHGQISSDCGITDSNFGLTRPNALRLTRSIEGYQWIEEKREERTRINSETVRVEVSYRYRRGWTSTAIESWKFEATIGHENPEPRMPLGASSWTVEDAKVYGLRVPPSLVNRINDFRHVNLSPTKFAADLEPSALLSQDQIYISSNEQKQGTQPGSEQKIVAIPPTPSVGDIRVSWTEVSAPEEGISILALQQGGMLKPWIDGRTGHQIYDIKVGHESAPVMISHLLQKSRILTRVLRVIGGVGNYIGIASCLSFLPALAGIIPLFSKILEPLVGLATSVVSFGISFSLTTTIVSVAWLRFRPVFATGLAILASMGFLGTFYFYYAHANGTPQVATVERVLGGLSDNN